MPEQPSGVGPPTVVVSHLDIVYRVVGGSRRPAAEDRGPLARLRGRREQPEIAREVHAVKDVSFVAHHGESIGIIGRNGSGKSTLLRAVAGLIPPTKGQLWVAGEPSLLGVNAVLMSQLSGERNIYIGGQALGLSRDEVRERFDDIVDFSGIGDAVYRPMRTYSSGMGARLRFAISTSAAPDVLMIDEALATGDAHFRQRSNERIKEIREGAGTVFLVSHSNGSIRAICNRVLWLDEGRLVMDGPTEDVLEAYEATLPGRTGAKRSKGAVEGVERVGGDDRIVTAAEVSRHAWPDGAEGVFVVPRLGPSTLLSVAPTAARLGWPVLLTYKGALPDVTADEISRLAPQQVVLVGDEELVGPQVEAQLRGDGATEVTRVEASSPLAISRELVRAVEPGVGVDEVVVITDELSGVNTAFATRATLSGAALLVLDDDHVDDETLTMVRELGPSTITLATTREDLPDGVVERLGEIAPVSHDTRRSAPRVVAEVAGAHEPDDGLTYISLVLATYETMVTAVAAAKDDRPMLVLAAPEVSAEIRDEIARQRPRAVVVVGGQDQVGGDLQRALGASLPGAPTGG